MWPLLSHQTIPYLAIICHMDLTRSWTLELPSYWLMHYQFASKWSIQSSTNAWNTKKHSVDSKQTICKVMNVAQMSFQLLRQPFFVCVVAADEVEGWVSDQCFNPCTPVGWTFSFCWIFVNGVRVGMHQEKKLLYSIATKLPCHIETPSQYVVSGTWSVELSSHHCTTHGT